MEIAQKIRELDEIYGKDNWFIRRVSKDARGRPSLTLSSIYLEKIDAEIGDKVLVAVKNGKIIIQKL